MAKPTTTPDPIKKETVKNGRKTKLLSTQRFLSFEGVHDDTLVLKNGGVRAILSVSSLNINLKSEEEQNAIVYSFQGFLNSLEFPVQILVQSRRLDIDIYLDSLKGKLKDQPNELMRGQMKEYIEYIGKLVEFADIMEKKFYVIVPANPQRAEKKSMLATFFAKISPDDSLRDVIQRKQEFAALKKLLDERVNVVQTALENCSLQTKKLDTEDIIQLFYESYNPDKARTQRMDHIDDIMHDELPEDRITVTDD
ncbi:MAG TPA: hypothetical protein VIT68_00415 [Candidatus Gracilibacteria bacterium]